MLTKHNKMLYTSILYIAIAMLENAVAISLQDTRFVID